MAIHGTIGAVTGSLKIGTSGAAVTTVLDEDNMSSDSATSLATQQSIKAYVDASTPATLGAITNVNTTDVTKAAGHVLIWDNSNSRWENAGIAGTANEIGVTLGDGSVQIGMPDDVTVSGDLTVGAGTAADRKILFDGNAQDYHIGLDDSDDTLKIGVGSTLGADNKSAIHVTSGSFIGLPLGNKFASSVRTTQGGSSASSKWTMIAKHPGIGNHAHASAVFFVSVSPYGHTSYTHDSYFIVRVRYYRNQSTSDVQTDNTDVVVETYHAGRNANQYIQPDHFVMTYDGVNGAELWFQNANQEHTAGANVFATFLHGHAVENSADYDNHNTQYGWELVSGISWESSMDSLGTDVTGTRAKKHFKELTIDGTLRVSGSLEPGSQILISSASALVSGEYGNEGQYHMWLHNPSSTTGHGAGLAFTVASDQDEVGGAIVYNRTGNESKGEMLFLTKQNTSDGGDPTVVMTLGNDGRVTIGESDSDGSDRLLTFAHSTIKSSIGIDDSADRFAINTDNNFESGNDLEIDTSGNVYINNGDIYARGGSVHGAANGQLNLRADTNVRVLLDDDNDGSAYFRILDGGENIRFEVDESGNVQFDGDLTVTGGDIGKDGTAAISIDSSENVQIANGRLSGPTDATFNIDSDGDIEFQVDRDGDGGNRFIFKNGGGSEIGHIDEVGLFKMPGAYFTTGSVGIGTQNPQTKLHVASSTGASITLSRDDTDIDNDEGIGRIRFRGSEDNGANYTDLGSIIVSAGQNNMDLSSDCPTTMEISLVPDGTNSEAEVLTLDGEARLNLKNPAGVAGMYLIRSDSTTATDDLLGGIAFDSSDGNIPSSILHGSAYIAGYAAENHSTGDKGGYLTIGTAPINQDDDTASTERMRITAGGRIGIGTTTPTGKANSGNESAGMVHIYSTGYPGLVLEGDDHAIMELVGTAGSEITIRFTQDSTAAWTLGLDNSPAEQDDGFSIKKTNNGTPDFYIHTDGDIEGTHWEAAFMLRVYRAINGTSGWQGYALIPVENINLGGYLNTIPVHSVDYTSSEYWTELDSDDSDRGDITHHEFGVISYVCPHDLEVHGGHFTWMGDRAPLGNVLGSQGDGDLRLKCFKALASEGAGIAYRGFSDMGSQISIGDDWTEYYYPGETKTIDLTSIGATFAAGDKMAWTFQWDCNDADKFWLKHTEDAGSGNDGVANAYSAETGSAYAIIKFFGKKTGGNGVKGR